MRRNHQTIHDAPKKSRFADVVGERYNNTGKLSIGMVKFYNDSVVQAVTFAYLIY